MGMFKNFMLRQALKHKMKELPEAEREKMISLIEKNPEFFQKIGEEIKKRTKAGESELSATMVVMRQHQAELQKLMR